MPARGAGSRALAARRRRKGTRWHRLHHWRHDRGRHDPLGRLGLGRWRHRRAGQPFPAQLLSQFGALGRGETPPGRGFVAPDLLAPIGPVRFHGLPQFVSAQAASRSERVGHSPVRRTHGKEEHGQVKESGSHCRPQ